MVEKKENSIGTMPQAYELLFNSMRHHQKGASFTKQKKLVLVYGTVVLCYKLGLPFVEIMNTMIVVNEYSMDMLTSCSEICLFSSQVSFSLSGGFVLILDTSPLC